MFYCFNSIYIHNLSSNKIFEFILFDKNIVDTTKTFVSAILDRSFLKITDTYNMQSRR